MSKGNIELSCRITDGSFEMKIELPLEYSKPQMEKAVAAWLAQSYALLELQQEHSEESK